MSFLAFGAFGGAFAVSAYSVWSSIVPNLDRITAALYGDAPQNFQPLSNLVLAERRIAVRRWAATPGPVLREAA